MDELTQQQTQARFRTLPVLLRNTLADPDMYDKIALVAKKYGLTRVESGLLAQVVGALMLGLVKPNEFIAEVMENINIERDEAMHITQELNREIFNDVKDLLKELGSITVKKSETSVRPAQSLLPARGAETGIQNMASVALPKPAAAVIPPPQRATQSPGVVRLPASSLTGSRVEAGTQQAGQNSAAKSAQGSPPGGAGKMGAVMDHNQPVRSDWGWHGKKNEVTGQIEFKHEETTPGILSGISKKSATSEGTVKAGDAHVGSIFEQKLGGVFTIKSEATKYDDTTTPSSSPVQALAVQRPMPPAPPQQPLPSFQTVTQRQDVAQAKKPPMLHVPHKPTQTPTTPPVQVFQQPKS